MVEGDQPQKSDRTVLVLGLCLLVLILLLILFYKKLVKLSNGEYAIRHMVYKEGGIRDRTRAVAQAVGSHLGLRMWPDSNSYQDGEEMQEVTYDVGQVEDGCSQDSDSVEEEEEVEAGGKGYCNRHDTSSSEGSEAEGQSRHESEVTEEVKQRKEEKEEEQVEDKGETSGGSGLLIDLNQFSGSVIWSEEEDGEEERNVTAL